MTEGPSRRPSVSDDILADWTLEEGDTVVVVLLAQHASPAEGKVLGATPAALILVGLPSGRYVIPWHAIAAIRPTTPANHPAL